MRTCSEADVDLPLRARPSRLPDARPRRNGRATSDLFRVDKHSRLYRNCRPGGRRRALPADSAAAQARAPAALEPARGDAQPPGRGEPTASARALHAAWRGRRPRSCRSCSSAATPAPYLEPAPGDPSLNVLKMAREGLLYALRTACTPRAAPAPSFAGTASRCSRNGAWDEVDSRSSARRRRPADLLVLFDEHGRARDRARRARAAPNAAARRSARDPRCGREPAARAGREPRLPAVDHPGARGRQRGAAIGQRGDPVEQRGAAEHQRGAGHRQGGAAEHQRGAQHGQRGAARAQRGAQPRQQRPR